MQRRRYEAWRKTLLHCLAHVEAVIDFGDDNDIESGVAGQVLPSAMALCRELESHLRDGERYLRILFINFLKLVCQSYLHLGCRC